MAVNLELISEASPLIGAWDSDVSVASTLNSTRERFQNNNGSFLTETVQHIVTEAGSHFYGIHRDQQDAGNLQKTLDRYAQIKLHLLQQMGLEADTPTIEIVGGSQPFSLDGTEKAYRFLEQHLPPNAVWFYGYTGRQVADGTKDVNALVSSYAKDKEHLNRLVGNLVGFSTLEALKNGKTGPDLQHYFLVYGNAENEEEGTRFGADVITSDYLADSLLLLEGGVQSFRQACHFLLLKRPIVALMGVNTEKGNFREVDGKKVSYFNAADFLSFLEGKLKANAGTASKEEMNIWYDEYFKDHLPPEASRMHLLEEGWNLFLENRLWENFSYFRLEK